MIQNRSKTSRRDQLLPIRVKRRGVSLIEMMVVISALAVVFTLTGTTIHLLLRSEKVVSQSLITERTVARLANLFRDDVHRAETAVEIAEDGTTELRLSDAVGIRVSYLIANGNVLRAVVENSEIVARDGFRLPECRVRFAQDAQSNPGFLSLIIERPAVVLQKNSQLPRPLRKLEIQACLDRRKRLLADDSSPRNDVKIVRSNEEKSL